VRQVEIGPRIPGSEGHRETLEYLQAHLKDRADQVSLHRFRVLSPLDSTELDLANVIAVFNPDSPVRLCFGAHWDTRPIADQEEDEALRTLPVPGANDGASGVAVLLELAEQLRTVPPTIGVDLLFFDGEDSGRVHEAETFALGSQRFVADFPLYRPQLVVILDMVGRRGTRIAREGNSALAAPAAVENLWALGRELGVTVLADSTGEAMFDDHIPFLQAGIPAVDLIDPSDPSWHTTRDLPDGCAPESLEGVGRLVLGLIRQTEQAQRP
jgi:Zn-dependent M28 family amino/carboxypeptidase